MTPEQKQRLEQIESGDQPWRQTAYELGDVIAGYDSDVDFLLCLVQSQAAGGVPEHIDMEIVESLETPARIVKRWLLEARNGRALESVLLARDRELLERYIAQIVTSMRSACVEKVRAIAAKYEREQFAEAGNQRLVEKTRVDVANAIAKALESLSIEKPQQNPPTNSP